MSTQEVVHAEPVLGSLNLARVSRADGVDRIGPNNTGFEIAHMTPEFQAAGIVQAWIETQISECGRGEISLVAEVVDGQQGAYSIERGVARESGFQIRRDESRLPIVRVHHGGSKDAARNT